jgi:hypothetical protein
VNPLLSQKEYHIGKHRRKKKRESEKKKDDEEKECGKNER